MNQVDVLRGRNVPLGGLRALEVRRTLPHRRRPTVGAWCFVDHYGPEVVRDPSRDGMDVPPHPHTGLQTVSWLFAGEIEHRDSAGAHQVVRPGELNLMTSGYGIAHSEVSTAETTVLHGVQLWIALPDDARHGPRGFVHHAPNEVPLPDSAGTALVFIGELLGVDTSPVVTRTPLLGAELRLPAKAHVTLPIDPTFEHALLVDTGEVGLAGARLTPGDLGCLAPGDDSLEIVVGDAPVRAVLLGGPPFEESFVMWWNFIGRSHDEIARARAEYEAGDVRFGQVPGYSGPATRIPAPPMPGVTLRPRRHPSRNEKTS